MCNDRCPDCDGEIEPRESFEITPDNPSKMELAIRHLNEEKLSGEE